MTTLSLTSALDRVGMTRYPLYRKLGCPQDRSGVVGKISPPAGFVALYRLSYRDQPTLNKKDVQIT